MAKPTTEQQPIEEKILYIHKCPTCGKFEEHESKVNLGTCGHELKLATPKDTIKKYKKTRRLANFGAILFTVLLPIFTICMFMFVKEEVDSGTGGGGLGYKLPILAMVLIGAVMMKSRVFLDRAILNTSNTPLRMVLTFFSKNTLYLVVIGICTIIVVNIQKIEKSLINILIALAIVVVENTIGFIVFDYKYHRADYIIKRAIRQAETIQALEIAQQHGSFDE
jgi:hypothetical protein